MPSCMPSIVFGGWSCDQETIGKSMSPTGPKPRGFHQLTPTYYVVELPREQLRKSVSPPGAKPRGSHRLIPTILQRENKFSGDPPPSQQLSRSWERDQALTFRRPPTPNSATKP